MGKNDDFERRLRAKYGAYLDIADEALRIARDMVENRPMLFHSAFDGLTAFFFAKSYKTFAAVTLLAKKGFGEDAAVLSRGLVENATNLLYIGQDPEARADLYLEYEYVVRHRYIEMLESSGALQQLGSNQQARERLRRLYESVKHNYPNENQWSGKSVRQMAEEVGLGPHYYYAYKYFSDIAHSGPSTISQVLQLGEQTGFIEVLFGPDETFIVEALIWSSDLFWRVLAENNEVFSIDFHEPLSALATRMREVFGGPLDDRIG